MAFGLSQPTISHHLRVLRQAGLVEAGRRGARPSHRLVLETTAAPRGAPGG